MHRERLVVERKLGRKLRVQPDLLLRESQRNHGRGRTARNGLAHARPMRTLLEILLQQLALALRSCEGFFHCWKLLAGGEIQGRVGTSSPRAATSPFTKSSNCPLVTYSTPLRPLTYSSISLSSSHRPSFSISQECPYKCHTPPVRRIRSKLTCPSRSQS